MLSGLSTLNRSILVIQVICLTLSTEFTESIVPNSVDWIKRIGHAFGCPSLLSHISVVHSVNRMIACPTALVRLLSLCARYVKDAESITGSELFLLHGLSSLDIIDQVTIADESQLLGRHDSETSQFVDGVERV